MSAGNVPSLYPNLPAAVFLLPVHPRVSLVTEPHLREPLPPVPPVCCGLSPFSRVTPRPPLKGAHLSLALRFPLRFVLVESVASEQWRHRRRDLAISEWTEEEATDKFFLRVRTEPNTSRSVLCFLRQKTSSCRQETWVFHSP